MNCIVCHQGQTRPGTTTVTFHRDRQTVVVNEVPAEVCENCGEAYVAEDATAQVLAIAHAAREAQAQVFVRNFAPAARPQSTISLHGLSGAGGEVPPASHVSATGVRGEGIL